LNQINNLEKLAVFLNKEKCAKLNSLTEQK